MSSTRHMVHRNVKHLQASASEIKNEPGVPEFQPASPLCLGMRTAVRPAKAGHDETRGLQLASALESEVRLHLYSAPGVLDLLQLPGLLQRLS